MDDLMFLYRPLTPGAYYPGIPARHLTVRDYQNLSLKMQAVLDANEGDIYVPYADADETEQERAEREQREREEAETAREQTRRAQRLIRGYEYDPIVEGLPATIAGIIADDPDVANAVAPLVGPLVPPLVADALAADDAPAQAAAIAAEAAVTDEIAGRDMLERSDPQVPQLADGDFRHAWVDLTGAISLYSTPEGQVVAPLQLDTPRAGRDTPDGSPYLWVPIYDAETDTYPELVLGEDGCVPQWALDRWSARMGITGVGTRTTSVALTLSASTATTDTATAVHLRWPLRLAADVRRFRIHLRNYNDRSSVAYTGTLSLTGIWVGPHAVAADGSLTGQFDGAPERVLPAQTTPSTGAEMVTPWIDMPLAMDTDYLVSLGYTCAAQTNHAGIGGCWRSAAPAQAGDAIPATALTRQGQSPLDVWVEVEIADDVPVIAAFGDSLTCGTGATLPVYDAWAARHGRANGYVPQIVAHHGSSMTDWTNTSAWKWVKYAGIDRPDAVVWALGGNDLFGGATLATMQSRFAALVPVVRGQLASTLYLATIMPRNDPTYETVRSDYNAWLDTLPGGAINVYDFAGSIAVPGTPDTIATAYDSGDHVHLNTAGYARNARAITDTLARVRR